MTLNLTVTKKQKAFIDSTESEVLFGGAAGGGRRKGDKGRRKGPGRQTC